MTLRRRWSQAATVAAVLALASCSGGSSGAPDGIAANLSADTLASEVSSATSQATSTHIDAEVSYLGTTMTMSGDLAATAARDDFQALVSMNVPGEPTLTVRVVDNVVYLAGAGFATDSAKPWASIDLDDSSNPLGSFYEQLVTNANPAEAARMFEAVTELDNHGTDDVGGVAATHYTVRVDLAKALELVGLSGELGQAPAALGADLPDQITYDVWLETSSALMLRLTMELPGMEMDLRFSDWGEPVAVRAPPAGQVTPFSF